jgi:hypothetical protein
MSGKVLSVIGYLLLGAACAQPNEPDGLASELSIERLRSEPYPFTFYSGVDESERTVIRNVSEWGAAWARIYARHGPSPPPLPSIDFSTRSVILVALGARPHGGFGILLTGASRIGSAVTIRLQTWTLGPGCGTTLAVTQVVDLATIALKSGDFVQFEETPVVKTCG